MSHALPTDPQVAVPTQTWEPLTPRALLDALAERVAGISHTPTGQLLIMEAEIDSDGYLALTVTHWRPVPELDQRWRLLLHPCEPTRLPPVDEGGEGEVPSP